MSELLKNVAMETEAVIENYKAELTQLELAEVVDKKAVKALKAKLRTAESALKKANAAIAKEEAKAEKAAEKAAKVAAKEKAKADKELAKAAKAEEHSRLLAEKAAAREANRMPEQNGIRRPKPTTKCGRVWAIADDLSEILGQPTPVKDLLEKAKAEGLNEGNVKAEYARWRKYYGITGRISTPKSEVAA